MQQYRWVLSPRTSWRSLGASGLRPFWLIASIVLTAQLVGLFFYSSFLYGRGDLTADFAHNAQAWFLIAHGTLDPTDTVRIAPIPFWRDHFDLVLWPLSLLHFIWPKPIVLLWAQDIAIVVTELVTLCWVAGICEFRLTRCRNLAALLTMVVLVANPWWYEAASFDVHMPPLGLPLVVGTAYCLCRGRYRRACITAAFALLFGAVVAELVIFVGVAGLLSRQVRRAGGLPTAAGLVLGAGAWVAMVTAIGADQASNIGAQYGYLVGAGPNAGAGTILAGVTHHPAYAWHVLVSRWSSVEKVLSLTGYLGILSPWGAAMAVATLLPAALAQSPSYSQSIDAFQTLAAVPFLTIGTLSILISVGTGSSGFLRWLRQTGAWTVATVLVVAAAFWGWSVTRQIPKQWWLIDPKPSATLQGALKKIPPNAEVIASEGVMGPFADRKYAYQLVWSPQIFWVKAPVVVFVIAANVGLEQKNIASTQADLPYVVQQLGGHELALKNGVAVVEWFPTPGTNAVIIP